VIRKWWFPLFFIASFLVVGYGQPSWVSWLAPFAAACGFAFFWVGLSAYKSKFQRFCISSLWFTCVQLIHLSWMTSVEYQGSYILIFYVWFASWLGAQFGLLTLLIPPDGEMKISRILALASCWTIFEWSRFYFLCGFSWAPTGLALSSYLPSLQFASVGGVLGLSFWVMLVNGAAYNFFVRVFSVKIPKLNTSVVWLGLALFPYLFGLGHLFYHDRKIAQDFGDKKLRTALVQTGLLPSQKLVLPERLNTFISPWEQWRRILSYLKNAKDSQVHFIVLPEVAVPFHCDKALYANESVLQILSQELGKEVLNHLPPLHAPFAEKKFLGTQEKWMVSNSYWAQAISNFFQTEVIIGLEDEEQFSKKSYNAAFHFVPQDTIIRRYEKRVLLPLAEYLPFKWLGALVSKYGIADFFTKGSGPKVFNGVIPFSISICYEETFPDIVRENRLAGAELLVNVTNDNWYPDSRLPRQHFDLGRFRAVENGMPVLRSCNTGVSAVIDSLGRPLCSMQELNEKNEWLSGALITDFPLYHYKTIYTYWGDGGLIGLSLIFFGFFLHNKRRDKNCL
jgi:apolipoprotein N-acyltransferase